MRIPNELVTIVGALSLALVLIGCGEDEIQVGRGIPADGAGGGAAPPPPPPVAEATPAVSPDAGIPQYRDDDFVEADTNRDPFRSFAEIFVARPTREPVQREVVMPRTAIDDMRLIAIVSGMSNPSAMLVDTDGTGHTVQRGDYIGRPEVVQTGGEDAVPITLNWRVDRIRPAEVVLTREDPTAPNRPPLTRVLPLHNESMQEQAL